MKKYIKNVTDDNKTVIPALGRPYSPAILAFKEGGKKIVLKPGESVETKMNGANVSRGGTRRLRLVEEKDIKKEDKKVKEDTK